MEKKVQLYYDGDCAVCTRIARRIEESARGGAFQFLDIRTGSLPPGASLVIAIRDVHAIEDGTLYRGGDVVIRVLNQYPRWQWLATVLAIVPFVWLVRAGYEVLKRNRWLFKHFI